MNLNKIARWLGDDRILTGDLDSIFNKCIDKLHWHYQSVVTNYKPAVIKCWRCEIKAIDLQTGVQVNVFAESPKSDRDAFFDALDKLII